MIHTGSASNPASVPQQNCCNPSFHSRYTSTNTSLLRSYASPPITLLLILLLALAGGCQVSWDTRGEAHIAPIDKVYQPDNPAEKETQ